ncbi:MAG TPA: bifunctional helix-turn-helix transcriptional regulator/GNAT family N-acetyltransferase [Bacteroidales bacterium]|nr:bifunctional helix-turn-helix transcriptional regulator/GNAT family N-acetyltransferase [Bacteroidales bacterium]
MKYLQELGMLAMASRLKMLSEKLMADGIRVYRESGLDFEPRWFPVTYYLKNQGPTPLTAIAKDLNQSHPAIVQVVRILEKKGLVVRIKDGTDSRINRVGLSDKGIQMLSHLEPVWNDIHQAARSLVNEHAPHFVADLEKIENALEETSNYIRIKREMLKREPLALHIVPFDKKHLKAYREMNLEWLSEYVGVSPHDKAILKDPFREVISKGGQVFIVTLAGEVVGTFTLAPVPGNHCELSKFVVKKEYRRLGIGHQLLDMAIGKAREAGCYSVLLLTHPNLKEATRLYIENGFCGIPGHPGLTDQTGRCSSCMQRVLNHK